MTEIQYRLADDVRFRRVLDEAVAVRQETNEVIVVNEVSASILDFLEEQGAVTVSSLVDHLASQYEVDLDVLQKDTKSHIKELLMTGIIVSKN